MKRIGTLVGAAASAVLLLATVGCDHIRDYSVSSYQGVMPMADFRPSGSVPSMMSDTNMPVSSIPTPPPTASPAAGSSSGSGTQPASSSSK